MLAALPVSESPARWQRCGGVSIASLCAGSEFGPGSSGRARAIVTRRLSTIAGFYKYDVVRHEALHYRGR
jgi:hypothetical protein